MTQDLKISIIVPVYNVEEYLPQCVNSVLGQTYQNLEVILVDDGSLDGCPALCDEYAKADSRVRVIHKENGGASSARNAGLRRASGEYVLFLDGDDWWSDSQAVFRLVERIHKTHPDVLNFSYSKFVTEDEEPSSYFGNAEAMPAMMNTRSEQLRYLTANNLYIASACNKMICRRLFDDKLLFIEGVSTEDIEWSARLLCIAKSFDFVPENIYRYRQRVGSVSHSISEKTCMDIKNHIISCVQFAEKTDDMDLKNALYHFTAFQLGTYVKIQAMAEIVPKDYIRALAPYHWLFRYHGSNRKVQILYFLNHIFTFPTMCSLFRVIYGKRH